MRKLFSISLFCLFVFLGVQVIAQDAETVDMKSMSKKERKEYRKKLAIEQKQKIIALIQARNWVLEATSLQLRSGQTFQLQPTINFVGVDQDYATIQLGSSFTVGSNGVGGVTLDGKTSRYEINEGKKPDSSVTLNMIVTGPGIGTSSIFLTVSPSGNAVANLIGMQGQRLTYRGDFKSLIESRVFKGMPRF